LGTTRLVLLWRAISHVEEGLLAGLIPEDKVAEVKQAADIVQVISETVALKKAGRNYQGLCPFHVEKTPSFSVNSEKQIYHCFGCGVGGNVISFIMRQQNISFPEAIQLLAGRYGISLPEKESNEVARRKKNEREQLLAVTQLAQTFFRSQYEALSADAPAKKYIADRGFTDEVVSAFEIGYVPDEWDALASFLLKHQVNIKLAQKAGLLSISQKGDRVYDRFRNRILFPVFDEQGKPIAFGGRVVSEKDAPKYLNSPETPIFYKGKTLFGLHLAKVAVREKNEVFIVEGNFDLLAMYQHGFINTVATMGTALTETHVDILRRILGENGTAIIVFDSDKAGIAAAHRSIEIFERGLVQLRIVVLPENSDPDSFLFREGSIAFKEVVQTAQNPVHFLITQAISQHGRSLEAKARIVSDLLPVLSRLQDVILRGLCVKMLSEELAIDELVILERIRAEKKEFSRVSRMRISQTEKSKSIPLPLEEQVLSMVLKHPKKANEFVSKKLVESISNDFVRSVILKIAAESSTITDITLFTDMLSEEEKTISFRALMDSTIWDEAQTQKLEAHFETYARRKYLETLNQKIKTAEQQQDTEALKEYLLEKQSLAKKMRDHRVSILQRF